MASAAYLDDTDAEVIDPPKNEMLDVAELVGDLIEHSPKPNMIVSSNMRELLEALCVWLPCILQFIRFVLLLNLFHLVGASWLHHTGTILGF
jgi:hypothetical protein